MPRNKLPLTEGRHPSRPPTTIERLQDFAQRGAGAQAAVDAILAQHQAEDTGWTPYPNLPPVDEIRDRLNIHEGTLREHIRAVANQLRKVADTVERRLDSTESERYSPPELVEDTLNTVLALHNLYLGQLVKDLARVELDRAMLTARTEGREGFRPLEH
jgi:hypothetical protein